MQQALLEAQVAHVHENNGRKVKVASAVQCMIAIVICKLALTQMAAKAVPMLQAAMDCITHGQAFEFWVVSNMTVCLASEPAG